MPWFTVRRARREELPAVESVRIRAWQVADRDEGAGMAVVAPCRDEEIDLGVVLPEVRYVAGTRG